MLSGIVWQHHHIRFSGVASGVQVGAVAPPVKARAPPVAPPPENTLATPLIGFPALL